MGIKHNILRLSKGLIIVLVLTTVTSLSLDFYISFSTSEKIFKNARDIAPHQTGVILGTSYYLRDGEENPFFMHRVRAAVHLYKMNKIKKILASGARHSRYYDETRVMVKELKKRGIPTRDIMIDKKGYRTITSISRAKTVYGLTKFIIISQRFHNERALFLARNLGMDAVAFDALSPGRLYSLKTRLREILARVRAAIDLFIIHTGEGLHD